jgi:hypothetical protein
MEPSPYLASTCSSQGQGQGLLQVHSRVAIENKGINKVGNVLDEAGNFIL